MTDNRPICVNCSRAFGVVVRFEAVRNGIIIPYGDTSARHGDLYRCPECKTEIVTGFGEPAWRPDVKSSMLESELNILKGVTDK